MSLTMMMFIPVLPVLLLFRTSAASSFASFNRKGHAFDTSSSIEKVKGGQNCVIVEERTALQHPLHHHGRRDHFDFRGGGAREGGHYDASGRGNIHVMQTNINGIERRGSSRNDGKILSGVTVIITAPVSYAPRLASVLEYTGATILSCPTVATEFIDHEENTAQTIKSSSNNNNILSSRNVDDAKNSDDVCLSDAIDDISSYDYIAFTSRKGIEAALRVGGERLVMAINSDIETGISKPATTATTRAKRITKAIALGADAQALFDAGVKASNVLVPESPTPDGIVQCLLSLHKPVAETDENSTTMPTSSWSATASSASSSTAMLPLPGQHQSKLRILCPIPRVANCLSEPPVVPNFLASLRRAGNHGDWQVLAVDAYITKWTGPSKKVARVMNVLRRFTVDENGNDDDDDDDDSTEEPIIVIAISSTAEVEGLLKLCDCCGVNLLESLKSRLPSTCSPSQHDDTLDTKQQTAATKGGRIKIAAHGPVTARGINAFLGVAPTAISKSSSSFQGMIAAIAQCCGRRMTTI